MKAVFIILIFGVLSVLPSWAQERDLAAEEDSLVAKVAQEKAYPGGRDEDDLEVQQQLSVPVSKMAKKKENVEAPVFDDEF